MLSSFSSRKSNPKWLDRLRSSKGFSTAADADLDHFLANQNKHTSISPKQTDPHPQIPPIPSPPPFLGDVLAELFAFGPETSNLPSKKAPRKTPNPRICKVERFNNGELNLRSESCSRAEKKEVVGNKKWGGEEEEKMDWNLSGFSRTEVAVIDTSFEGWKFEKVLFRKKSVWKVRDRKSRVFNCEDNEKKKMKMKMKKKRKLSVDDEEERDGVCKKKKKRKFTVDEEERGGVCKKKNKKNKSFLGQCSLAKEGNMGEFSMRINDEEIAKEKFIC